MAIGMRGGAGRGREWWWGLGRSGDEEQIWSRPESSPENFSGGGGRYEEREEDKMPKFFAEHASVFLLINLDELRNYDPLLPPPTPHAPFTMAAYQQDDSEMDPQPKRGSSNRNWSEVRMQLPEP
ncbi:hypothetical protein Tco_0016706 [Tanacetum coccineum]